MLAAALVGAGWRATYAVTALLALLLLWLSMRRMAESRAGAPRRVDRAGLVLLVLGMSLLLGALTQGRDRIDRVTVVLGLVGLLALAGLAAVECRVAEPLIEPGLLRHRRFRAASLGSLTLGLGIIGMTSFVPTLAQLGLGIGLWGAGLLLLAWAGTSVVTSLLLRHSPWHLEGSFPVAALLVGVALGQLLGLRLQVDSSPWHVARACRPTASRWAAGPTTPRATSALPVASPRSSSWRRTSGRARVRPQWCRDGTPPSRPRRASPSSAPC